MSGKGVTLVKRLNNGCLASQEGKCWLRDKPCIWRDRQDCNLYWETVIPNSRKIFASIQSETRYDAIARKEAYQLRHD